MDALIIAAILVTFAAFCTAHVALSAGIASRGPWWRGLIALVVVPLAPYWGFREKLRGRVAIWAAALALYMAARVAGARFS